MVEYRYTLNDRIKQLETLQVALKELIHALSEFPEFAARAAVYKDALETAERLSREGFSQEQLSKLSRAVPDLYYRYKEWCPPMVQTPSGTWEEAAWFTRIEEKLQPVLKAAEILRILGYY